MSWLVYAFLAAILYTTSIITDQYLLEKNLKNVSFLTVTTIASLAGIPLMIVFALFYREIPDPRVIMTGFLSGWAIMIGFQAYYQALSLSSAALVAVLFQLVIPFNYVFGIVFFDEKLGLLPVVGLSLIILASIMVSFEERETGWSFNKKTFYLMGFASLFVSGSDVIFKKGAIDASFMGMAISEYAGALVAGFLIFMVSKKVRREIFSLKGGFRQVFLITQWNEGLNLGATLLLRYAIVLGPIALVQGVMGTQPVIALLLGGLIAVTWPTLKKYRRSRAQALVLEGPYSFEQDIVDTEHKPPVTPVPKEGMTHKRIIQITATIIAIFGVILISSSSV